MLIKCPECAHDLSDKAAACPYCGCPASVWQESVQTEEKEIPAEPEETVEYPFVFVSENEQFLNLRCNCCHKIVHIPRASVRLNENQESYTILGTYHCSGCDLALESGQRLCPLPPETVQKEVVRCALCGEIKRVPGERCVNCGSFGEKSGLETVSVPRPGSNVITKCPQCGGVMNVQVINEEQGAGCGTMLLYAILALTVVGILIVIPLAMRKKETIARSYAVCQNCGYKTLLS